MADSSLWCKPFSLVFQDALQRYVQVRSTSGSSENHDSCHAQPSNRPKYPSEHKHEPSPDRVRIDNKETRTTSRLSGKPWANTFPMMHRQYSNASWDREGTAEVLWRVVGCEMNFVDHNQFNSVSKNYWVDLKLSKTILVSYYSFRQETETWKPLHWCLWFLTLCPICVSQTPCCGPLNNCIVLRFVYFSLNTACPNNLKNITACVIQKFVLCVGRVSAVRYNGS